MESYSTKRVKVLRQKAIIKLGEQCLHCGLADIRALQFDHIDGKGCKNRHTSQIALYSAVLKGSEDFQLLCANCNTIKRVENKEIGQRWPKEHIIKRPSLSTQNNGIRL